MPAIEKEITKLKKNFGEQLSIFQNRLAPFSRYSRYFSIDKSISGYERKYLHHENDNCMYVQK
jgi:hypothetical protein